MYPYMDMLTIEYNCNDNSLCLLSCMRATKDCQSYLFQASGGPSTLPPLSDARCSWVCFSSSARCTVKGSVSDDPLSSDDTSDQSPSPSHDDGGHDVLSAAGEQMLPGLKCFP